MSVEIDAYFKILGINYSLPPFLLFNLDLYSAGLIRASRDDPDSLSTLSLKLLIISAIEIVDCVVNLGQELRYF